ncbi:MAG: polysaccharide deacetylase family protein [Roseovarius sp.]
MPRPVVYLTVDVEPDCPPFLWTWRGIEDGMPKLLTLLQDEDVPATFFTTGASAEHAPGCIADILERGHELACHGYSHTSFRNMDMAQARDEITRTNEILRAYAPVTSFRAPYLSFPERFVPLLAEAGFEVDSSRGVYKRNEPRWSMEGGPYRLDASITSSALRIPKIVRNPWFAMLKSPVTLFVHPWEFVDLTQSGIRYDCRFRTGQPALDRLRSAVQWFKARGYQFDLVASAPSSAKAGI